MSQIQGSVARIVSQVVLETSGRCVAPAAEDDLFAKRYLEEHDLGRLVMALQEEFDFALGPAEINPRVLNSIGAIATLVAARSRKSHDG